MVPTNTAATTTYYSLASTAAAAATIPSTYQIKQTSKSSNQRQQKLFHRLPKPGSRATIAELTFPK